MENRSHWDQPDDPADREDWGPPEDSACPECAVELGLMDRQKAFDIFFGPSTAASYGLLPRRRIVRSFVGDRADPTAMSELSCGHVVF